LTDLRSSKKEGMGLWKRGKPETEFGRDLLFKGRRVVRGTRIGKKEGGGGPTDATGKAPVGGKSPRGKLPSKKVGFIAAGKNGQGRKRGERLLKSSKERVTTWELEFNLPERVKERPGGGDRMRLQYQKGDGSLSGQKMRP